MKNTQPNNQELKRIFVSIIILGPLAVTMMDSRPLVSAICIAFILMLALKGLVSLKDK
ncbi:hypothetical protein [Streptococcus danieliae]|uniref:Uncharacterized protein n=1 Tax=Streptococcus danieliae TaxID=747656 RepID=A0A7Z0S4G9_9STRE|nr:hypothetical protein [Streptococcus danieliae]MBF0699185.1 hypothetical protein [Streptococcus danieliae]NYS96361.1 hypothetical protein [Streptococcus danieliae]